MMRKFLLLLAFSATAWTGFAQKSYNEQVLDYIARYKDVAIAEQKRTGVPAAIKLAQGIFETAAGGSELCVNASNHFGIKCKNTWTGDTYSYTDDAKDECFRKYESALASYKDHSDFLKNNKRYSTLFQLSPTDYAAWAYGLKRCGYATNPQYAKRIIKTIEDFKLQEYTYAGINVQEETPVFYADASGQQGLARRAPAGEHIPQESYTTGSTAAADTGDDEEPMMAAAAPQARESGVKDYYVSTAKNGKRGFYARKGDMLLEYAIKNKIRYAKILELNDLSDAPLEADMFIYLERKSKSGNQASHIVKDGETLSQISQQEGVQLAQLRLYNHLDKGEEPAKGTVLSLQGESDNKPEVYTAGRARATSPTSPVYAAKAPAAATDNAYVTTNRKATPTAAEMEVHEEETAAPLEKTVANRTQKKVNIADETPVEETIANERSQKKKADESKMTALEKLKAHMDRSVYADRKEHFSPQQSGTPAAATDYAGDDEVATVPARKAARAAQPDPEPSRRNSREAIAKGKDKHKEQPKAKAKAKSHTVKRGETAFGIAERYDITVSQLQKWNKLSSAKKIQPGMKLKVQP